MLNTFGDVSYKNQHISQYNKTSLFKYLGEVGFEMVSVEPYLLLSPFFALFGWDVPDYIRRIEPSFVSNRFGLLLLGEESKHLKASTLTTYKPALLAIDFLTH
jgi:hypothetical protein